MSRSFFVIALAALLLTCGRIGEARAADDKEQDEQKVAIKQVPHAVRKTFKREAHGKKIKTVDKERLDGKTVYEADVEIDGHNYEIVVGEDGLLLSKKLDNEDNEKSSPANESQDGKKNDQVAKDRDESGRDKPKAKKRAKDDDEK